MRNYLFIFLPVALIAVALNSCKRKAPEPCSQEGYVIGFDPQTARAENNSESNKGFVIAFVNSTDTVVAYNLPDSVYTFSKELFLDYKFFFLFPASERIKYKVRVSYHMASKAEKQYPGGPSDINMGDFVHYVRDRQIVLECARKGQ